MSVSTERRILTVALVGNPNTGKSTLFNSLAGVRQRVGNYPGVTVEKKIGRVEALDQVFELVDLPGTYSLAPHSPDEMIAVDVLLGRRRDVSPPHVVLCIVDASNLERNLYLVSQVLEMGLPTVVALNMVDVADRKAIAVDVELLQQRLGVPVVPTRADRGVGRDELLQAIRTAWESARVPYRSPFPPVLQEEVAHLESMINRDHNDSLPRYLVERLLLDTGYLERASLPGVTGDVLEAVRGARSRLSEAGHPVPAVEAIARYEWVRQVLDGVVTRPATADATPSTSDRLDKILTHRVWGTLLFAALMLVVFQAVFTWAVPLMEWIDVAISGIGDVVAGWLPPGALQSLLVDGVIAGVGAVLVFLPQIFILFLFIALLEDCGYMARAAYLMDRLMSRIGLSGKSFIPLLSSFACAIPGIMAARVIENRQDRLVTMLVAPLMSCSARLPVYTLMIAAFIPGERYLGGWLGLQGLTLFSMYLVGIVAAVLVALALKKTFLRGAVSPFVMELPGYKLPCWRNVLYRMFERGWAFVRRAGTLIFAVTVLVWAAMYYPHQAGDAGLALTAQIEAVQQELSQYAADGSGQRDPSQERLEAELAELQNELAGAYVRQSFLGRVGQWVEPVVAPLGWDWRIGCAVIASFPAREVVIGTLGVIYNLGEDQDAESLPLRERLRSATWDNTERLVFNVPVALSVMVFFALCAQCASTLAVLKRETNSWRWPLFALVYMTVLAYVGALVTYRVGMWLVG